MMILLSHVKHPTAFTLCSLKPHIRVTEHVPGSGTWRWTRVSTHVHGTCVPGEG